MRIETQVDTESGLTIQTARGELTLEETKAAIRHMPSHPAFRPGSAVLWDLRACEVALSTDDVRQLVIFVKPYSRRRGAGRSATVVAPDMEFQIVQMITETHLANATDADVKVFTDLDEAMQWLGVGTD